MDDRIKKRLNGQTSVNDVNGDIFEKVSLNQSGKDLPIDPINVVIDEAEEFNKERQASKCYRVISTLIPNVRNTLFDNNNWLKVPYDVGNNILIYDSVPTLTVNSDDYDIASITEQSGNLLIAKPTGTPTNNQRITFKLVNNGNSNPITWDGIFRDGLVSRPTTTIDNASLFIEAYYNATDDKWDINNTFNTSINAQLGEDNGWFGYKTDEVGTATDKPCTFYDFTPKREELYPLDNAGNPNWMIKLTRPTTKLTPTNSIVDGGLLVVDSSSVVVGNRDILLLTTPVKHNLEIGSLINISGFAITSFDTQYKVVKLGDSDGDKSEYIFGIDVGVTIPNITVNTRIRRVVGGKESEYYFRRFDVIDDELYSDVYKLPLSKQVYSDNAFQVTFDDINIDGLVDHLNRPVTEIYLTISKMSGDTFTPIKSGFDVPYIPNMDSSTYSFIEDIHRVNESPTSNPSLDGTILPTNTGYTGDVVEYNEFEVTETVLADVHHSFNTLGRLTGGALGNRYEGYYYKAHYKFDIKQFSNYIEQGDSSSDGIPTYAVDLGDGRFLWRDILDIGVNNGQDETLDYPFTNGCHYLYNNICINLYRQDPFNLYDLYYTATPADYPGIIYDTTDLDTKNDNTNC